MNRTADRLLPAAAVVAAIPLFVALFLPWFHVTQAIVHRTPGFIALQSHRITTNAWTGVTPMAGVITAAVVLVVAGSVRGPERQAWVAGFGAALAVLFVVLVLLDPPTVAVSVFGGHALGGQVLAGRFAPLRPRGSASVGLAWGGFVALAGGVVSLACTISAAVLGR